MIAEAPLMAALTLASTDLVRQTYAAEAEGYKVVAHEGSSGSSKTVSLAQVLMARSFEEAGKVYTVTRATLPALKKGALRDWQRVLQWASVGGVPARTFFAENRTDWTYTNLQTGTLVEFVAFDEEQKARGPRRDRLWLNEANETHHDVYRQLAKRTRGTICLDYNPSMQRSWIYDHVLTRADCKHVHSTYRVNVFLTPEEVREIEVEVPVYELPDGSRFTDWQLAGPPVKTAALVAGDPYQWAVFGLGQRAAPGESVYPALYESTGFTGWACYGLDFGYKHPTVLLRIGERDAPDATFGGTGIGAGGRAEMHFDEVVFGPELTLDDLAGQMEEQAVSKGAPVYADGARPEMIEGLRRKGYNVLAADKGPGSVFAGIAFLKRYRLCFTARSRRTREQFADYRWQKGADGVVMDKPVKFDDDGPDAARYGAFTYYHKPKAAVPPRPRTTVHRAM